MELDWVRLGEAVRRGRLQAGWKSGSAWAKHVGISENTAYNLEAGKRVRDEILLKIEMALKWPPGQARRIARGDDGLTVPEGNWEALAREVQLAHRIAGNPTYPEWSAQTGLPEGILYALENGKPVDRDTLAQAERQFGWPAGQALDILAGHGGEPVHIQVGPPGYASLDDEQRTAVDAYVRFLAAERRGESNGPTPGS